MVRSRLTRLSSAGAHASCTGPSGKLVSTVEAQSARLPSWGLLERHGPDGHSAVRAATVDDRKRRSLSPYVREHVVPGSEVYADALRSYDDLGNDYIHGVIDHAERYVDGKVHTNGIENFWSLLKRAIKGTYVNVEPFHLFRYLNEETFRYNTRKADDGGRFQRAAGSVVGKRLTYAQLIGASTTPG